MFAAVFLVLGSIVGAANEPVGELVFPLDYRHNHAPGIVECPNGDLLVSWYRGSGERSADDVAVYGAWKPIGSASWSEPFLLADRPGFPDCNTCLFIDRHNQLWLFWPTVLANRWETCLTNYRVARQYKPPDSPIWDREGLILLKPDDFSTEANQLLGAYLSSFSGNFSEEMQQRLKTIRERLSDKLYQRLGWQPRNKPLQLPSGRILLPLYTDTFSISIMAISDDGGQTWFASKPLIGWGNIQPTLLRRNDGTIVAYMRENGPRRRIRVAYSRDDGISWSPVTETQLANPGSAVDGVRLRNGHWVLVYNDTTSGRTRLAVSLSEDEGEHWRWTKYLEDHTQGAYHYPQVIQSRDEKIHVVYSYFVENGKSIKHVLFEEAWIKQ